MLTSCKLLFDFDLFCYSDLLLSRFASTLFSSLMGSIDEPSMFKFLANVEILLLLSRISFLLFLISSGLDSVEANTSVVTGGFFMIFTEFMTCSKLSSTAYPVDGRSGGYDFLITFCCFPSSLTFDLFSLFFASICPSFPF
jgi:hypothetical protein